jgi:haloacetate dehalogenase
MTRACDEGRAAGALAGLHTARRTVGDARYAVAHGGSGPPVLLLHGFPQTHLC